MKLLPILFIFLSISLISSCSNIDQRVGFLSPMGVDENFASKTDFALINVYNKKQLEQNLQIAKNNNLKLYLDFGPVLNQSKEYDTIKTNYIDMNNVKRDKVFEPLKNNKLRSLPSDENLALFLKDYMPLIKNYNKNIDAIFLVDEPYLNGINKKSLENAAKVTRQILDENGLKQIKLGVIFASAMFNKNFASTFDKKSGEYVKSIDEYHNSIIDKIKNGSATDEEKMWIDIIKENRLTTYDNAGNMYTGGGIPKGFDIYTFDFYLSTFLLDSLYNEIPKWLANQNIDKSCDPLKDKEITDIKKQLSFFRDGPVNSSQSDLNNDKQILDTLYFCRMKTVTNLLEKEVAITSPNAEIIIISESSSNGVLEFTAEGIAEPSQPNKLIEMRVLDEVKRAKTFYNENKSPNISGILFFLYADEYDKTIKLNIGGAKSMPSVLNEIYTMKK